MRQALDGYEAIQKANGKRDSRHRIEHIEVCQPDDMPRFKELGVIASMQTSHAPVSLEDDMVWTKRTGPQRWHISFPWRDLKNAGAHLSLGSDWTVAPFDPVLNIYVALNRKKLAPENPNQNLTLEEHLSALRTISFAMAVLERLARSKRYGWAASNAPMEEPDDYYSFLFRFTNEDDPLLSATPRVT